MLTVTRLSAGVGKPPAEANLTPVEHFASVATKKQLQLLFPNRRYEFLPLFNVGYTSQMLELCPSVRENKVEDGAYITLALWIPA